MTIDGVKRTAQQQVNRALKDRASSWDCEYKLKWIYMLLSGCFSKTIILTALSVAIIGSLWLEQNRHVFQGVACSVSWLEDRFLLDLDIAAPKITIPTEFCPDNNHSTKLLIDLGNLIIRSQDDGEGSSPDEINMYLQFDLILSDVSAFLVDGDYSWSQISRNRSAGSTQFNVVSFLPVIDKCGVILELQQIRSENPSYPSTRLAVRLPSLGFHFSPARYHRLMQVVKIFQQEDNENADLIHPWNQADFEGWLSVLTWKGVGNREAVWQRRYLSLVGPGLYVLESPDSTSYKQYLSYFLKEAIPMLAGVSKMCHLQSNVYFVVLTQKLKLLANYP
ncbi:hypothetical protein CsSME_00049921 [Camellia sinensis var. sinensis]